MNAPLADFARQSRSTRLSGQNTATQASKIVHMTPTILCVDDDPDITRTIELRLSNFDVRVVRNFTGMQGIWQAIQLKPDLIVTDLRVPQGNGEHLLECLKRNRVTARIPVIVLSGQTGRAVQNQVQRLGADSYLQKPIHYEELLDVIRQYVDLRKKS